jgi:hypothetical protein
MTEAAQIDVDAEVTVRPLIVDVYAFRDGDDVLFTHAWKRDGDPKRNKGHIHVPKGESDVPIHFKLHDRTEPKVHLAFISNAADAMWVDLNDCPTCAGNGGQITFDSSAPSLLKVTDANSGPECVLHYALRFDGDPLGDCPPYEYDPEIRNGGN